MKMENITNMQVQNLLLRSVFVFFVVFVVGITTIIRYYWFSMIYM